MAVVVLLTVGCVGAPGPQPAPVDPPAAPPTPAEEASILRLVDVGFEGRLPARAEACGPTGCLRVDAGPAQSQINVTDLTGSLDAVSVELSWTPSSPATRELYLGAVILWPECNECEWLRVGLAKGVSPLRLDIPELAVALDTTAIVQVFVVPTRGDVGVPVMTTLDQPFHVRGNLLVEEPAEA